MDLAFAFSAFVTLFVVIDPIGTTPIFVALTSGTSPAERRRIAFRAIVIATGILTLFGVAGSALLDTLGITLPAFRIAGGLLLFLIATDMLFERRTERREKSATPSSDPSVFPLATPLVAGPGAIAAMILLNSGSWTDRLLVFGAMLCVVSLVLVLFLSASPIERLLGRTGTLVVTRLLGMLLAALSVQFVIDGLQDLGVLHL